MDLAITDELKRKGLQMCQKFVGGSWASLHPDNFQMEYQHGGLSNMLYLCSVSDKVITKSNEPRKVMMRLFGKAIRENPEVVVSDQVISAVLAEKKLIPKLFGAFAEGRVEEYVESRTVTSEELHHPDISVACARIMARYHHVDLPINKQPCWLFDLMTSYLNEAFDNVSLEDAEPEKKMKLAKIFSLGLKDEFDILKDILLSVHSPVVFSHNDLRGGNILFCQDEKGWHLIPIDFEQASYNYRGFDFGNHFCEWCFEYTAEEFPYFTANLDYFPTREQQFHFFRAYLEETQSDNVSNMGDSALEQMYLETTSFALASHYVWGLWSAIQAQTSTFRFGFLEYALARFDAYFKQKKLVMSLLHQNGRNV